VAFTNQTVSVSKVMEYFYEVPDYQRGYVWDSDRVIDLIMSAIEHFSVSPNTNYFIGAAVFEQKEGHPNKYYVVDGQQRLTTIFIIVCAAHNIMRTLGAPTSSLT